MVWHGPKNATQDNSIVHRSKRVIGTKEDGWLEDWDSFRRFIDDSTNYHLNLYFKIVGDSTVITGRLGIVDTRKESFDDYIDGEYQNDRWINLKRSEIDSLRNSWGI